MLRFKEYLALKENNFKKGFKAAKDTIVRRRAIRKLKDQRALAKRYKDDVDYNKRTGKKGTMAGLKSLAAIGAKERYKEMRKGLPKK